MFEKLQQSSRLNDAGGFPYLRSHPLTTERIADMQLRVRQSERASTASVTTLEHAMVAARARVFSDSSVDALRVWETQAQGPNLAKLSAAAQVGTLYGASFAALKQRDFALAQATLARLQERIGTNAPALHLARLLALDMVLAQGDVAKAQRLSQSLSDSSRATLLMRSHIDTLAGQGEAAAQTLQTWLADHPHDAQAWQALAAADAAIARPVAAVRAEAEVNVAQLDYQGALTRFKAAQDMARKSSLPADHIDASIVDTRARQMESLLREQTLER
jgi:predicted Zn-dependent protease